MGRGHCALALIQLSLSDAYLYSVFFLLFSSFSNRVDAFCFIAARAFAAQRCTGYLVLKKSTRSEMQECNRCKRTRKEREVRYHDYETGSECKKICSSCYRLELKRSKEKKCDRCRRPSSLRLMRSPLLECDRWCYYCIREYNYWYYMDYSVFSQIP